jgi:prevent-host-death family protein
MMSLPTNSTWQLQEAKNRFSEVVEQALQQGPQTVTRHGREAVVIMAYEEFRRMSAPKKSLLECLQVPREYATELDIERSRELPRDIEL